jgi:hypothetical protein
MNSIESSHRTCDRCISSRCLSNSDIVMATLLGNASFADSLNGDILAHCVEQSEGERHGNKRMIMYRAQYRQGSK